MGGGGVWVGRMGVLVGKVGVFSTAVDVTGWVGSDLVGGMTDGVGIGVGVAGNCATITGEPSFRAAAEVICRPLASSVACVIKPGSSGANSIWLSGSDW